jgi:hypothetical protein
MMIAVMCSLTTEDTPEQQKQARQQVRAIF